MKSTFQSRLINGPFEDPCLYVRLLRERRALMFDAGDLRSLSPGHILKLSDVFITHTHIDHFVGFDTILRMLLRRESPLRIYGPENITDCVEGKLGGYAWNLIGEYPIKVEVFAISGGLIRHSSFYAEESFRRRKREERPFSGVVLEEPALRVRAVELDHGIPCMGYSLEEELRVNIDRAALSGLGVKVGPWLSELKAAIRRGDTDETVLEAEGRRLLLGDVRHVAMTAKGQKITYITDAAPSEENLNRIREFSRGSDILYCEAYFLEEDRERAIHRNHLTARTAGRVAKEAGVKDLRVMHFSPKYKDTLSSPLDEAMAEFRDGGEGLLEAL